MMHINVTTLQIVVFEIVERKSKCGLVLRAGSIFKSDGLRLLQSY